MATDKDNEDDFLDDLNLDDVDFDSLLEDDTKLPGDASKKGGQEEGAAATPPPSEETSPESSSSAASGEPGGDEPGGPTPGDDLLASLGEETEDADVSKFLDEDTEGSGEEDVAAFLDEDTATAGGSPEGTSGKADEPSEAPAAGAAGGEPEVEELTAEDLLCETPSGGEEAEAAASVSSGSGGTEEDTSQVLDQLDLGASDESASEELSEDEMNAILGSLDESGDDPSDASSASPGGEGPSGEGDEDASSEETTDLGAAGAAALGAAAGAAAEGGSGSGSPGSKKSAPGRKKLGKKPSERFASKKGKKPGRGRKPGKAGKRREKAEGPARETAAKVKGSVRFICSECYAEFHLPPSFTSEALTCPECLHVGKRPDENFLRTVNIHKAGERKSLVAALAAAVLLFGVFGLLVWLRSPYCSLDVAADPSRLRTWTYGLLGGGGVLLLVFLWLLARFEGNRWDVYF